MRNSGIWHTNEKTPNLTDQARQPGMYHEQLRPFCLPLETAVENLYEGIQQTALDYFEEFGIKWHDGGKRRPSNHLCSSQVCCVNFLYPFANEAAALASLLRPVYPNMEAATTSEGGGQYFAFEWIGEKNYLGEKVPRGRKRIRGEYVTSADAMIRFRRNNGLLQTVLIEWKYTEAYDPIDNRYSKWGTDRTAIYRHLYDCDDFPLDKKKLPSFESLFYEPFYQLLRQQLLAHEMEKHNEGGADIVTLLHITPAKNTEIGRVTSPDLRPMGDSVIDIWKELVVQPNRFQSISVEELFGKFPIGEHPVMSAWWDYITDRYPWSQYSGQSQTKARQ